MAKISAYAVTDFSGGVRRDKSLYELQKNELLDARNVEIDERGRLVTRRGSQQVGNTLSGTIENSFVFVRSDAGGSPTVQFLVNNTASAATVSRLIGTRLTAAVAVGDTTINVVSSASFAASGTIEVDGDLISYTGTGAGTFTGCSGIARAHPAGRAVHQWATLTQSGTAIDGRAGVSYAVLNNTLIFGGRAGNLKQYDGANVTDVSGEPSVLFLTNYRDRLYGAGDGSTGTNGDPRRVSFSGRGDGTSWTTASDFFDVEDQRGEYITGFRVLNDRLGIFKTNSLFTYDEIELKQRLANVGAYSNKVIQEIGGILYTFCPEGIFATNLSSARQIGEPVKQYWKNFFPLYDSVTQRVVTNTFSGKFENHYLLYIFDITDPTSTNDVVLDYNTKTKAWSVYEGGFTNFSHLSSFDTYDFGDSILNFRTALFGGDSSGKYFRFFENRYVDNQSTPVFQGSDIYEDLVSDTGSPVSAVIECALYDMGRPDLFKKPKALQVLVERGAWNVEYRVENETTTTSYRTLGSVHPGKNTLSFPSEAAGFRIGLRFSAVNTNNVSIMNGFIFKDIEVAGRR